MISEDVEHFLLLFFFSLGNFSGLWRASAQETKWVRTAYSFLFFLYKRFSCIEENHVQDFKCSEVTMDFKVLVLKKTHHANLEKGAGKDLWLQAIFSLLCGKKISTGFFFGEKYDRPELSKFCCTFGEGGVWEGMTENSQAYATSITSCAVSFISCQREWIFLRKLFLIPVGNYQ